MAEEIAGSPPGGVECDEKFRQTSQTMSGDTAEDFGTTVVDPSSTWQGATPELESTDVASNNGKTKRVDH